jgi:hypothetical protein
MLSLCSSTTSNSYYLPQRFIVTEAARQGPAEGVTPVFIPLHPTPSILFVFYHREEKRGLSVQEEGRTFGLWFYLSTYKMGESKH